MLEWVHDAMGRNTRSKSSSWERNGTETVTETQCQRHTKLVHRLERCCSNNSKRSGRCSFCHADARARGRVSPPPTDTSLQTSPGTHPVIHLRAFCATDVATVQRSSCAACPLHFTWKASPTRAIFSCRSGRFAHIWQRSRLRSRGRGRSRAATVEGQDGKPGSRRSGLNAAGAVAAEIPPACTRTRARREPAEAATRSWRR